MEDYEIRSESPYTQISKQHFVRFVGIDGVNYIRSYHDMVMLSLNMPNLVPASELETIVDGAILNA